MQPRVVRLALCAWVIFGAFELSWAEPIAPGTLEASATSDQQRILGLWICIRETRRGKVNPHGGDLRAVVTEKELKISGARSGMTYSYRLDPTATPKALRVEGVAKGNPWHIARTVYARRRQPDFSDAGLAVS